MTKRIFAVILVGAMMLSLLPAGFTESMNSDEAATDPVYYEVIEDSSSAEPVEAVTEPAAPEEEAQPSEEPETAPETEPEEESPEEETEAPEEETEAPVEETEAPVEETEAAEEAEEPEAAASADAAAQDIFVSGLAYITPNTVVYSDRYCNTPFGTVTQKSIAYLDECVTKTGSSIVLGSSDVLKIYMNVSGEQTMLYVKAKTYTYLNNDELVAYFMAVRDGGDFVSSGVVKERGYVLTKASIVLAEASTVLITKQPVAGECNVGDTVRLSIGATSGSSYRWQYSNDGGASWNNIPTSWAGYNTNTLTIEMTAGRMGFQYRCVVTGSNGTSVNSQAVQFFPHLEITRQPVAGECAVGDTVKLSVAANGVTSYRWQYSNDGGATWGSVPSSWTGYNSSTLTIDMTSSRIGFMYRCAVSSSVKTIYTNEVMFTRKADPVITSQPVGGECELGSYTFLTVAASNATGYRWQFSKDGGATWTNVPSTWLGYDESTLWIEMNASRAAFKYRCAVSGTKTVYSNVVSFTPMSNVTITSQPVGGECAMGSTVTLSVGATGATGYRWQFSSDNGSTWTGVPSSWTGYNTSTLSIVMNSTRIGYKYRCAVSGGSKTVYTNAVKFSSMADPVITRQPVAGEVNLGDRVTLTIAATDATSYRWQFSSDNGSTWTGVPSSWTGYNSTTLYIDMNATRIAYKYRCAVSGNGKTIYSSAVKFTQKSNVAITRQPVAGECVMGVNVQLTIGATGATSYRWQFSKDGGATWTSIPSTWLGYNTTALTIEMNSSRLAFKYRCAVTGGGKTVYSNAVQFTEQLAITRQPVAGECGVNDTVKLSVTATGASSYRWQYSTDGTTWVNVSTAWTGYNGATLTIPMNSTWIACRYRCAVSNSSKTVYSTAVKFTQRTDVVITRQPVGGQCYLNDIVTMSVAATGATSYRWQYSNDGGSTWSNAPTTWTGYNTNTLSVEMTSGRFAFLYRCAVTGGGKTVYTNMIRFERKETTLNVSSSYLSGSTMTLNSLSAGSYTYLTITADSSWTVTKTNSSGGNWFTLDRSSGVSGTSYLYLTINSAPAAGSTYSSTLTFTARDKTVTITVKMSTATISVSSITLNTSSASIQVGNTTTLTATVAPSNATNRNVTWSSSNTSVATVSSNGVVTGVKAGTATITCTAADGSGVYARATITVTAAVTPTTTKYRALCIGNNYSGSSELPMSVADANSLAGMLRTMTATPYSVTVAGNQSASSMISLIGQTFAGATSNDVSLFYYSGHGVQGSNMSSSYHGALVGQDHNYVTLSQLRSALDKIPGKKIVLLDSCHSGNAINKDGETVAEVTDADLRAFANAVESAFYMDKSGELIGSSYYVMAACRKDQTSTGFYRSISVFTAALESCCGYNPNTGATIAFTCDYNGDKMISLAEAFSGTTANVSSRYDQVTVCNPSGSSFVLWGRK